VNIISASRREDMPAFRMDKIVEKMAERPDDFFVLWTKNPHNIVKTKVDLSRVALQLTVTGLGGSDLEPGVPAPDGVWSGVKELVRQGLNPNLINWRMDPILPSRHCSAHVESLSSAAADLGISRCMISFITFYDAIKARWPEWEQYQADKPRQVQIVQKMQSIVKPKGIDLFGCVQPHLSPWLLKAHCIDGAHYSKITGFDFSTDKDAYQRKSCGCTQSVDIGKYRPCPHKCVYCYAKGPENPVQSSEQPDLF